MVAEPSASPLRFEVLGPVRGWREGLELDLGSGKQRAVLAVLLLHRNTAVTTSRIVDAVWGDEPPVNGANVVQKYVAGLRRSLEPARTARAPGHLLALDDAGYTLAVGPDQLDLDTFDRLRRSGLRHRAEGRHGLALRTLRDAASLVGGEPLAGLSGDWFAASRARLVEERADTVEACVELELALGRHEQALPEIRDLVARFPLRERLRSALVLALYRSGRPAEALAAFQTARHDLVEALGAEPGPALQDLHARVLRSDPSLLTDGAPPRLAVVPDPEPARPRSVEPPAPAPVPPSWDVAPTPGLPVPGPRRRQGPVVRALLAAGAAVVTLATLGLAGVLLTVGFAAAARGRRQVVLFVLAACFGALFVAGFVLVGTAPSEQHPRANLGTALLFVEVTTAIGTAIHALYRRPDPA